MGWGSWHSACSGHPDRTAKAEVGIDWCGPCDLLAVGVLAGELRLRWVQAGVSQGSTCRGNLVRRAEAEVGFT